jgi:uncharacterized membrane protein HdeD (DUF308 family)
MDDEETHDEQIEKVTVLNTIFEGIITDASDLVKDLQWGVKTYMFFGLISILFGVQELVYYVAFLEGRLFSVPLVIAAVMIFSGSAQILNFVRLRKKYSRLFHVQEKLKHY